MSNVKHTAAGLLVARFAKRPRDLRRARRIYPEIAACQALQAKVTPRAWSVTSHETWAARSSRSVGDEARP